MSDYVKKLALNCLFGLEYGWESVGEGWGDLYVKITKIGILPEGISTCREGHLDMSSAPLPAKHILLKWA